MKRLGVWLFVGFLIVVSIFFGMNLANQGIERVHGPMDQKNIFGWPYETMPETAETNQQIELTESDSLAEEIDYEDEVPPLSFMNEMVYEEGKMDRFARKTGDALEITAKSGIRVVVAAVDFFLK